MATFRVTRKRDGTLELHGVDKTRGEVRSTYRKREDLDADLAEFHRRYTQPDEGTPESVVVYYDDERSPALPDDWIPEQPKAIEGR